MKWVSVSKNGKWKSNESILFTQILCIRFIVCTTKVHLMKLQWRSEKNYNAVTWKQNQGCIKCLLKVGSICVENCVL